MTAVLPEEMELEVFADELVCWVHPEVSAYGLSWHSMECSGFLCQPCYEETRVRRHLREFFGASHATCARCNGTFPLDDFHLRVL